MTDEAEARFRRRLEALIGIAATEGNDLRKLRNGDEIFPVMLEAIDGAQNTVDMLTYVYWRGDIAERFAETLAAAAGRGVRVRLLIDAVGGFQIDRALVRKMEDAGVSFQWFRKPWLKSPFKQNHRTHRKCLIVDETVGFTGGVGIANEWEGDAQRPGEWRDTHVRVEGPAVDGIAAAFAQNWAESGLPLFDKRDTFPTHKSPGDSVVQVVRSSASVGWDDLQTLFTILVTSAQRRVRITTAYFAPSTDFVQLLIEAAQ